MTKLLLVPNDSLPKPTTSESYDCYDTHRSIEIQVWFAESGQVFLRNLFSIPSPDSHFSEESWKKMEASTKKA